MKTKLILAAAAVLLTGIAGVATAQPSEYFIWKNNATGKTVCEPQAPAGQWTKQSGPYEDSNCKFKVPG